MFRPDSSDPHPDSGATGTALHSDDAAEGDSPLPADILSTTATNTAKIAALDDPSSPAQEKPSVPSPDDGESPAPRAIDPDHQTNADQTSNKDGVISEAEENVDPRINSNNQAAHTGFQLPADGKSALAGNEDADQVAPPEEGESKRTEPHSTLENHTISPRKDNGGLKLSIGGASLSDHRESSVADYGTENNNRVGFWRTAIDANTEADEEDFFNQLNTQTKPIYSPPDPDARFEEGMPLLDDSIESPVRPAANGENGINTVFGEDEDAEGGFFESIQKSSSLGEEEKSPSHITRKSTSQVIGDIGSGPDSPASETAPTSKQHNNLEGAPTSENPVNEAPSEEDLAARWEAELDDDDILLGDELAEDSAAQVPVAEGAHGPVDHVVPNGLNSPFESPSRSQPVSFTPHQPSTSDLVQGLSVDGISPADTTFGSSYFAPPAKPTPAQKPESFVERSKEGYRSPYDLPEDLTLPRRPHKPAAPKIANTPLPPRSSSIPVPPPMSTSPALSGSAPPKTVAPPKNFYEELPPPPRSRPGSSGRYTPDCKSSASALSQPPPVTFGQYPSAPSLGSERYTPDHVVPSTAPPQVENQNTAPSFPTQLSPESYAPPQLQQPEKLDPYTNLLAPAVPSVPSAASRYSPKPPGLQAGSKPPPSPRYSPAPPPSSVHASRNRYTSPPPSASGSVGSLPFQPRTSSPLAYFERNAYQPEEQVSPLEQTVNRTPYAPPQTNGQISEQNPVVSINALDFAGANAHENVTSPVTYGPTSPPRNPYAPQPHANDLSTRTGPVPEIPSASPAPALQNGPMSIDGPFSPPRRSRTQSPGQQTLGGPRLSVPSIDPLQRPASVNGPGSPTQLPNIYSPPSTIHARGLSEQLEFIPPSDGQQLDPLERWKGAPIVNFGFGGVVLSCFPKHIPRYTAGQVTPKIKSSPGEVKLNKLNDWVSRPESVVRYPGPLKAKSKKKDVLAWLSSKIAAFENEGLSDTAQLHPEPYKRQEEKVLLWKIVRVLVENDGTLEGSPDVQNAVRNTIFPNLQNSEAEQPYANGFTNSADFKSEVQFRPDSVSPQFTETLRNNLLHGKREAAVWEAVDNRLWGHAMIIASTLDKSVWKQVVQEFVRREMRPSSGNAESLAALYEIFAGNIEESIDELVPPSVRAGLQMVSKVNSQGPTKNALDGLDRWRETLQFVLSNRSPSDSQALVSLGRLLSNYGRTEAAHICYLFSRASVFGGADDPQSSIVLLGVDHQRFTNVLLDEDSIQLTEVYEYATSVLANSPTATLPHLLAFKLMQAKSLAEHGRTSEALQYCDAIVGTLKATTKPSVYCHQQLFSEVDELTARLKQTTSDGASSWISRPSMEKVSGSMWAKFNSFVSGEDSDAASTGSGKMGDADVGPFAKVTGTPTVSRSPSVTDLYGSYPISGSQPIPTGMPSRYHPGNQYAPNGSPDNVRGRTSFESQRSGSFGFSVGQRRSSQEQPPPVEVNPYQPAPPYSSSPATGYHFTPPQTSYMPLAPVDEDRAYQAKTQFSAQPSFDSFAGNGNPVDVLTPSNSGYMPATSGHSYEPPSSIDAVVEESERKPSVHDDDDMATRAEAIRKAEKEQADREAAEAFRKAAEADAKKAPPPKKGWFSGWFGGKKDAAATNNAAGGGGPIRAKLGEASSFYYDKELKRWVNKKDPGSSTLAHSTPPPPKGPAPQARSDSPGAPPMGSGPESRAPSAMGNRPPLSASPAPPSSSAPPLAAGNVPRSISSTPGIPPPRPATSLSNATSIDDLLGEPQARKGGSVRAKKKGRYVDIMAK